MQAEEDQIIREYFIATRLTSGPFFSLFMLERDKILFPCAYFEIRGKIFSPHSQKYI